MRSLGKTITLIMLVILLPLFLGVTLYNSIQEEKGIIELHRQKAAIIAQTNAAAVGKMFEDAIATRQLTQSQVFDQKYQEIPNTNPKRYHTQYDAWTDKNLPKVTESLLNDSTVVFGTVVDTNGYLPTHNNKFTIGDFTNSQNRTKRIFNDAVGLKSATNTEPYSLQEYKRDTGELVWDVSAPIYVNGQHWGAFRVGYSIDTVYAQIAAMRYRTFTFGLIYVIALILVAFFVARSVTRPLGQMKELAGKIAAGDLSIDDKVITRKDEIGELGRSFMAMSSTIRTLASSMNGLNQAAAEGKLDVRASSDGFTGLWQELIQGMNRTLDAVVGPLNVAAEYVDRISKGQIPPKITDTYLGDFNEIKNNLNNCIDGLGGLAECNDVLHRLSLNDHARKVEGVHDGIFGEMGRSTNEVRERLLSVTRLMNEIAVGDTSELASMKAVGKRSEDDTLLPAVVGCMEAIELLIQDTKALSAAAVEGQLDRRADASKHRGEYQRIIEGINSTLDAVIGPLNVAAEYVDRISKGDIPPRITDVYHGDFNEIKNNLNNCIDIMNGLVRETNGLIQSIQEGRLDTRGNAAQFIGSWGELVGGINRLIDAFVGPINVTAEYVDRISKGDIPPKITDTYYGDYNEIKNNLNNCIDSMNGLLSETCTMIQAVEDGKLDVRGNAAQFTGGWAELITGINHLIDAFVGPFNMAADYIDKISIGNIPGKITDAYNGDFNAIKNNLNQCIDAISLMVAEIGRTIQAGREGALSVRAESETSQGVYRKILRGINDTLDAVIQPVREASGVLQEMSRGNLKTRVEGDYKGDHAEIKNALNATTTALSSYISEITRILTEMSQGNLNLTVTGDFRGDFAEIKQAMNAILHSLNEMLGQMNSAAEQVAAGAEQVARSAQALSQASSEQAAAVEQTTAAMTQIGAQTKQNALNASQANELANNARENAGQGNEQMHTMLKAMEEINNSSNNISKIIKVIDEIAFQTNILALNAAVEAARAGQHGKGFAVVAEEVRNLAARSANAAKETTALIEGSMKKVEFGTQIANETAGALNKIVEGVTSAAELVGDIAKASNEQATGIIQVNQGIGQVAQVTQMNTATAQQSAAASEEMASQAETLRTMIGQFSLRSGSGSPLGRSDNSDIMRMVEDMIDRKTRMPIPESRPAVAASRVHISLDDADFGKY
ncbi:MAG: methyl-accepting chemotaxis protein [Solirubrobacterales bacterium]